MKRTAKTVLHDCPPCLLFPLVSREAREFSTCVFYVLLSRGPFEPMEKCVNVRFVLRGRFRTRRTVKRGFRRVFYKRARLFSF